ncbi:SH3 and cysteine-rich domain-containing protein [Anabarilius grahami]|uniref:SH3 and cysteine-rich domain-containing protein n=1 Tax=Anabarilius grahami TaxID=495550 RepID=A0A3N0XVX2_ANAGA|nr:SH3 and cysteine-rich domain-containing protein [Anabarilius grahami]
MGIHHKCLDGVGQQRCMGKLPKGFRRYSSSPLLIQEQFGCIREVMPIACGSKVDPVYETLRFGTSLAQKTKRASGSESPQRNSTSDMAQVAEEKAAHSSRAQLTRKPSDNVSFCLCPCMFKLKSNRELKRDPMLLNTYVALFGFIPQDNQDLEMRPGDRIILADDSNDDWWKGVIEDRLGFFPASFAHQVRAGDRVFRCHRTFIGCKEQGQITLKEGQRRRPNIIFCCVCQEAVKRAKNAVYQKLQKKINTVCYKYIEPFRKICFQRAVKYRDIILHKIFPGGSPRGTCVKIKLC